jgi:hypothetical protein
MSEVTMIGLDLAKNVFQVHGADEAGRAVIRKQLRPGQVLEFLGRQPRCVVAMEACSGAHFWGLKTNLGLVKRCVSGCRPFSGRGGRGQHINQLTVK